MFMVVHICFSLTATERETIEIEPTYKLFIRRLFLSAQPYALYWSPSCLVLGYWEKRQMFQYGNDGEEVRIFTLRSVVRSLCSAQRRPEGKRVFLGRLGLFGPYYTAQALGFSLGSGKVLWRAAPGAVEGHWSSELGLDECSGVSYTVWDPEGLNEHGYLTDT